jgi:hypothetical protein
MAKISQRPSGGIRLQLASWFEIDEMEYIEYILKGYTITADEDWVRWQLDGQRHRTDGPAVIYANGTQGWWLNNQLHRTDGPAVIWADGAQFWYLNGLYINNQSLTEGNKYVSINKKVWSNYDYTS